MRAATAALKTVRRQGEIESVDNRLPDLGLQAIMQSPSNVNVSVELGVMAAAQHDELNDIDQSIEDGIRKIGDALASYQAA